MDLTPAKAARFRQRLLRWAKTGMRDYPWRQTKSPYRLLLSELMLRRTRADQVVEVYRKVIHKYPTAADFCLANPDHLRELLKPLGLSWRIEDIVCVSEQLRELPDCHVPTDPKALRQFSGVGDYVANAVASFSGTAAVPIIDTNVVRVIGRVFGLRLEGEARRRKEMREAARMCLSKKSHRDYNYGIIDFAALVCKARAPECAACPLADLCTYGNTHAE